MDVPLILVLAYKPAQSSVFCKFVVLLSVADSGGKSIVCLCLLFVYFELYTPALSGSAVVPWWLSRLLFWLAPGRCLPAFQKMKSAMSKCVQDRAIKAHTQQVCMF